MEIKSIENFTLEDCEKFLSANQEKVQDSLYKEVLGRYSLLIEKNEKKSEEKRLKYQQEIAELRGRTKWIDIDQFLEKRKYFRLSKLRFFVFCVFLIGFILVIAVCYYTNTNHMMYADSRSEQLMQVEGLENILLNLYCIRLPWRSDFPCCVPYYLDGGCGVAIAVCVVSVIFIIIITLFNSSILKKIYNIQNGDKKDRIRAIENKEGKKGICRAGHFKMKKVLPFEYEDIFAVYENSYICKKNDKYGVFNSDLKKMTVPVVYDSIYSIDPQSIVLVKDNEKYCFTNKGYRLIK